MKFVEFVPGQSINVDCIVYFEDYNGRARIYCDNGMMLDSAMGYKDLKVLLESGHNKIAKNVEQIAKNQQIFRP